MRRTVAYAAMTKDEEQRSSRTFYEAVKGDEETEGRLPRPAGEEADPSAGEERKRQEAREKMKETAAGDGWSAGDRERIAAGGLALGEVERSVGPLRGGGFSFRRLLGRLPRA